MKTGFIKYPNVKNGEKFRFLNKKMSSQFGLAVWPAIANMYINIYYIYMNEELYYIDNMYQIS